MRGFLHDDVPQDGYPLLIASEESLEELQRKVVSAAYATEVKPLVDERWRQDRLEIERYVTNVTLVYRLLLLP